MPQHLDLSASRPHWAHQLLLSALACATLALITASTPAVAAQNAHLFVTNYTSHDIDASALLSKHTEGHSKESEKQYWKVLSPYKDVDFKVNVKNCKVEKHGNLYLRKSSPKAEIVQIKLYISTSKVNGKCVTTFTSPGKKWFNNKDKYYDLWITESGRILRVKLGCKKPGAACGT